MANTYRTFQVVPPAAFALAFTFMTSPMYKPWPGKSLATRMPLAAALFFGVPDEGALYLAFLTDVADPLAPPGFGDAVVRPLPVLFSGMAVAVTVETFFLGRPRPLLVGPMTLSCEGNEPIVTSAVCQAFRILDSLKHVLVQSSKLF